MSDDPVYLRPFVLSPAPVTPVREGNVDLYLPTGDRLSAAVVFVHGGPIPEGREPTPRDWPVYQGYGAAAVEHGLVGGVVDHRFHDLDWLDEAHKDIVAAVDRLRAHPRVDSDRIGLWFFSGGGTLMGSWIQTPLRWLRCIAASYPVFPPQDELGDATVAPSEAVRHSNDRPILLTKAGLERPELAAWVDNFVSSAHEAGANLEVIDVPQGQHAFDVLDHTDASRTAVEEALLWMSSHLQS